MNGYGPSFWLLSINLLTLCCAQLSQTDFDGAIKFPTSLYVSNAEREILRVEAKEMFYHGYNNYMDNAFPFDELNPVDCLGRGPDFDDPGHININDVLGDYMLTLLESLDSLQMLNDTVQFKNKVELVVNQLRFKDVTVQVFESTIRVLGSLLATFFLLGNKTAEAQGIQKHLIELGERLKPAFGQTNSGLPWPRVNLLYGLPRGFSAVACTAGVGTLGLEMGYLGVISKNPELFEIQQKALNILLSKKAKLTKLPGNTINVSTGKWLDTMFGVGAGIDSVLEYLLKTYISFGQEPNLIEFQVILEGIMKFSRKGRKQCLSGFGQSPIFTNVNMDSGDDFNSWIDSMQASWAAVLVLYGDLNEAICAHMLTTMIWIRFRGLPERFDWKSAYPVLKWYPLRPEFAESTLALYRATKNPFYLAVGRKMLRDIQTRTMTRCGFATLHNVNDGSLEDRMESFFLSETVKYLYLLFDIDHPIHVNEERLIFTTEGHPLPILRRNQSQILFRSLPRDINHFKTDQTCQTAPEGSSFGVPMQPRLMSQLANEVGIPDGDWLSALTR